MQAVHVQAVHVSRACASCDNLGGTCTVVVGLCRVAARAEAHSHGASGVRATEADFITSDAFTQRCSCKRYVASRQQVRAAGCTRCMIIII